MRSQVLASVAGRSPAARQRAVAAVRAARAQARAIFSSGPALGSEAGEEKATGGEPREAGGQGAGGQAFEGVPRDSGEGPSPRTSADDQQKTGGTGQQGKPSDYQPPHETGGQGRAMEPPDDIQ